MESQLKRRACGLSGSSAPPLARGTRWSTLKALASADTPRRTAPRGAGRALAPRSPERPGEVAGQDTLRWCQMCLPRPVKPSRPLNTNRGASVKARDQDSDRVHSRHPAFDVVPSFIKDPFSVALGVRQRSRAISRSCRDATALKSRRCVTTPPASRRTRSRADLQQQSRVR